MLCFVDVEDEYEDEDEFLDEFEDDDEDYDFHSGELHGAAGAAPTAPGRRQQQHEQAYGPDDTVVDEYDEEDEYEDYQDAEDLQHELLAGGKQVYWIIPTQATGL